MSELKNIIDMRACYSKALFGFAAAKTNLPASRLADAAECRNFDALEIQHERFDTLPEHRQADWKKRFRVSHAGSLTDRSLSWGIAAAPEKIRAGFVEESARLLKSIAVKHGFRIVTLDLPAGAVIADPEQREILRGILHKLYPVLRENGQTLLLPFRLPVSGGCSALEFSSFLRESMNPAVKAHLEIHPHELRKNFDPREIAGNLRFETCAVTFCYDADCGNRLLRQHLVPWLKYFALNAFYGPYFVCPFSLEHRLSAPEAESYSRLAEELKHKQE